MKLELKQYSSTVILVNERDDLDIHELMDMFYDIAVAIGYSAETVRNGFKCKAEELK